MKKTNFRKGVAAIGVFLIASLATAQPTFDWLRTYTGTYVGFTGGITAVKTDASGNVYVVSNVGNGVSPDWFWDIVVKKYNAAGTEQWSTTIDGVFDVYAYDLDLDSAGNVFVAGLSSLDATLADTDILCAKFNGATGAQMFSNTISNPSDHYGYAVVGDGSGGAWVAGEAPEGGAQYNAGLYRVTSAGAITLVHSVGTDGVYETFDALARVGSDVLVSGPVKGAGGVNDYDARLVRMNTSNAVVWSHNYNSASGESFEQPYDIAVDGSGNAYMALRSGRVLSGTAFTQQFGMVRKVSSSGAGVYATELGTGATYVGAAVTLAVNGSGEVFVASQSSTTGAADSFDIQVNKLNASGAIVNTATYNNPANFNDLPVDSAIDGSGLYVVAGWVPQAGVNRDILLLGYTTAGAQSYAVVWNNTANNDWDVANGMALSSSAIYIGGYTDDATTRYSALLKFNNGSAPVNLGPSSFTIVQGTPFGGGLSELQASDDLKVFILNDESTPNAEIRFNATSPSAAPSAVTFRIEASATRNDLSQFTEVQRTNGTWQLADFRLSTLVDSTATYNFAAPASQFIGAGNALVSRTRWIPTADLEAGDGWSEQVDWVQWTVTP